MHISTTANSLFDCSHLSLFWSSKIYIQYWLISTVDVCTFNRDSMNAWHPPLPNLVFPRIRHFSLVFLRIHISLILPRIHHFSVVCSFTEKTSFFICFFWGFVILQSFFVNNMKVPSSENFILILKIQNDSKWFGLTFKIAQ